MKPHRLISTLAALSLMAMGTIAAIAQSVVPNQINYQGTLTDADGTPFAENVPASFEVVFKIYNEATGGIPLWEEDHDVIVLDGQFSTILGVESGSLFKSAIESGDGAKYLEIHLPVQDLVPVAVTFTPRQKLVAAPYALVAASANQLNTRQPITIGNDVNAKWSLNLDGQENSNLYINTGGASVARFGRDGFLFLDLASGGIDTKGRVSVEKNLDVKGAIIGKDVIGIHNDAGRRWELDIDGQAGSALYINTNGVTVARFTTNGFRVEGTVSVEKNLDVKGAIIGKDVIGIHNDAGRRWELDIDGQVDSDLYINTNDTTVARFRLNGDLLLPREGAGIQFGNGAKIVPNGDFLRFLDKDGNIRNWGSGFSGSGVSISDRRLKADVEPLDGVLEKVLQLAPVQYGWKQKPSRPRESGFIAQEVEEVFPEVVQELDDGYKGLNYLRLGVFAIGAIQEMHAAERADSVMKDQRIEVLEKENEAMKGRLEQLETLVESIVREVR